MKFDPDKPHATIYGGGRVKFEQDGLQFDALGNPVDAPVQTYKAPEMGRVVGIPDKSDAVIHTDRVESAKLFLTNILNGGPLSKAAVFKISSENNQSWEDVKAAAILMQLVTYKYSNTEMWKLPENEVA